LVALAAQGRDILWNDKRAEGYVKFQNKLWQAFKFLSIHIEGYDDDAPYTLGVYDKWIMARLNRAIHNIRLALEEYRFNEAASELYAFVWHELCDWYLELSKGTLYNSKDVEAQQGARRTLLTVFNAVVRLMHPIMPFLSEELWSRLPLTEGFVMQASYPKNDEFEANEDSLEQVRFLQTVIVEIRRIRAEMGLKNSQPLTLRSPHAEQLIGQEQGLRDLCGVESLEVGTKNGSSSTFVIEGKTFFVPLAGVIDIDEEKKRLSRKVEDVEKSIGRLNGRLNNKKYVENAPQHIVQETRDSLANEQSTLNKLKVALSELEG
jgi:valyl-tRNA synthetase